VQRVETVIADRHGRLGRAVAPQMEGLAAAREA